MASKLQMIDCPLCGSKHFIEVYPDNPSKIVRCRECDLVFFNPQPSRNFLREFYSSQSGYMKSIEENLRSYERDPSAWQMTADFILTRLTPYLPERKGLRLLDIGCAYGFFLLFAKERGFDPYGLEISSETSRYAREHGLNIQGSTLSEAELADDFFDVIIMNNVLEHTPDPSAELKRVRSILRVGGIVYIAVPNYDSLVAKVDGYNWKMKSWPNHLYYFTGKTLSYLLQRTGFRAQEVFTHRGESDCADDVRVIRERLFLSNENEIKQAIEFIWGMQMGQEIVFIAQKI